MSTIDDPFDPEVVRSDQAVVDKSREKQEDEARAFYSRLRHAYVRVFGGSAEPEDRMLVRADLERFCRGNMTAFHIDERIHVLLSGRQEVWLRIEDFTKLSLDAIVEKLANNGEQNV